MSSLAARIPLDRPQLVAAATLLLAAALLASLAVWASLVGGQAESLAEQQQRLDTLMQRRLPAPAAQVRDMPADKGHARTIIAPGGGAAASILQNALSDAASQAGLSIDRLGVEPAVEDAERQVVVRIEGKGNMEQLQAFLFRAETGFPYVFVDMLDVEHGTDPADDMLAVVAVIRASWKAAPS